MIKGSDVLEMLCPDGGWILIGDDYEGITWVDDRPRCTKKEFEAGFVKVEKYKAEQEAAKQATKNSILDRLGITADEAKLLLG